MSKIFGHLNQHEVGSIFKDREALSRAGIHSPPRAGIWGCKKEGACSIVLSGKYKNDDKLDSIIYIGQGGQKGKKQIRDQEFKRGNLALKLSFENKLPIRVTRGSKTANGPQNGFRYDGIYYINRIERVREGGYFICKFYLQSENSIENLEKILALKPTYQRTTRTKISVSKVDRNLLLPNKIKELYEFRCQVCDCLLEKPNGAIAVGAHIRALGRPHDGPDDISNLICLCPNHHAQFDAFSFYIDAKTFEIKGLKGFEGKKLNVSEKHNINSEFFEYHMQLYKKAIQIEQSLQHNLSHG